MERAKPPHLPFLDGLRGVAVVSVFLFHAVAVSFGITALPWSGLFRDFAVPNSLLLVLPAIYGWAGVALFFAISGFCIHLSHARSGETGFGKFAIRRFFRIYPGLHSQLRHFAVLPAVGPG